ncbi:hypothetical protein POM88_014880 [Heracleum sosnowskyi]|uniref:Replication protein A 70 kDa DNA-binding subunit B/D first OB fold domain-containing protein n=1 Tax=Heracleum sosnowskyi TaxID=360622 RepID=A0AAD8MVT7_9APIA|nr:hypothetical protein POM88_014880 [Heracleum sosnowskyi]
MFTNIIFLDEEGNHMLAALRNNQKDAFLNLLSDQGVYKISNIKVVPRPALYRSVDQEMAINFYYKTRIDKVPDTGIIPRYKFELKEFEEMKDYVNNVKTFIDVMGMVISYGHLETRTNGARKMDVILANARNENLAVSLWENKALEFQKSLATAVKGAVFVVITGLLAKKFSDRVFLSSSDATTYLNIDYAPLG